MVLKSFPTLKPKIILGIAAHPDDLDFCAAGTIAKFAKQGAKVHYLILTDGGKGTSEQHISSEELTKTRIDEQRAALELLGGNNAMFLDYKDGELLVSMDLKRDIVRVIRTICPDVVITTDPATIYLSEYGFINHPDHRAAGQAVLDAVFPLARDHLSFPTLYTEESLAPHNVATVLLSNFATGNFCVDITDTYEIKLEAIRAHVSQVTDFQKHEHRVRTRALDAGEIAGCTYAEIFTRIDIADM